MVISRAGYYVLLMALVVERLLELRLSNRHTRRALAHGGVESGQGQYRIMVLFHTLFIVACASEATFGNPRLPAYLSAVALTGEAAAQALRYWAVATLGERWNTRVIVIPDAPPVTTGPYRYIRHPNYAAVALEIACVPLIRGLVITAAIFFPINAILLTLRIRLEEDALGEAYRRAFNGRPRFIPDTVR